VNVDESPQKVVIPNVSIRLLLFLSLASLLVLAGCTGDDDDPPPATPTAAVAEPEPDATEPADDPTTSPADATPTEETPATATAEPEPDAEPTAEEVAEPTAEPEDDSTPPAATGDLNELEITLQEITGGLNTPVKVVSANDNSQRIFVVEKAGSIAVVQDGSVQDERFLSIPERVNSDGSEQGLLGLAFHPDFETNGWLYVNYNDLDGHTVVSRFETNDDHSAADPDSELVLLFIEQPASNHNGGHILFGPDGYLYIGTGDGGGSGDTFEQAQDTTTLLGKMLRIDVGSGGPYGIPADNPFVDDPDVRDEIWATGLRNPWRYDFDPETGDLYIADVGQNRIEEVSVQPGDSAGGENYGWPIMEGTECFQADECDQDGLVLPVTEYMHDMGCSVTGGNVYRGDAFPAMTGIYFFSDFCSGNVWGLAEVDGEWQTRLLLESGYNVSSFGVDEAGELYLVDMYSGVLYRITAE
jgi:glucose/arabinose dehydrogenase